MQQTSSAGTNFVILLKKYVIENSSRILLACGSVIGCMALIGFFFGSINEGGGKGTLIFFGFLLSIMGLVQASQMFSDLATKQGRISFLMTPAPVWVKFLIRWCLWVPGFILVLILAFYVGDWSRLLACTIFDHSSTPISLQTLNNPLEVVAPICLLMYLALDSFFVLGAVLWPRLSFLKTTAALWVLQTLLGVAATGGIFMTKSFSSMPFSVYATHLNFDSFMERWAYPAAISFFAIVCLVNWSLTYLRLKETDAV